MEFFGIIIAAFFAILGAFALLNEFLDHLGKPRKWTSINRQRRSLIGLVFSLFTAVVYGRHSWITEKKRKEEAERQKEALLVLTSLEVNLVQIEGLLQNVIASENYGAPLNELKKMINQLIVYGARLDKYTNRSYATELLPISGHGDLSRTILNIKERIWRWRDTSEKPDVDELSKLLKAVGTAKIGVKNAINDCK